MQYLGKRSLLKVTVSALCVAATTQMVHADEPIPVVATFSILGNMVSEIGGEHVNVTTLVGPNGDAHVYQPTPKDARSVSEAELMFMNGLEFEGWLERLVKAASFDGSLVVATDGIQAIAFDDNDDHDDHDDHKDHDDHDDHKDHGDHADHDDHKDHEEHGHGNHGFEWAGVFDLEAGTYKWSFAKVGGDYADPAMKMVILKAGDIEAVEEAAEDILEADASTTATGGDVLTVSDTAYTLTFDDSKDMTIFSVEIASAGQYTFFTEHMPFEFEANEHFFKDLAAVDIEPIAQEPESGHAHHHHGAFDPHAWQSLTNAAIYIDNITAALAKADPSNAGDYYSNRAKYLSELDALSKDVASMMADIDADKRTVVTPHDAFGYFSVAYDITFEAPQGLSTESEASAGDVARLIEQIREQNISAVFIESISDNRLIEQIANETGASVGGTLYSDALSSSDGPASTYLDMFRHNAKTISDALK